MTISTKISRRRMLGQALGAAVAGVAVPQCALFVPASARGANDRIAVGVVTDSGELRAAVEQFHDYIMQETLAIQLGFEAIPGVEPAEIKVGDFAATLYVKVV